MCNNEKNWSGTEQKRKKPCKITAEEQGKAGVRKYQWFNKLHKSLPFNDDMPFFFMMVSDDSGLKPRLECLVTVLLGKYKIKIHPFLSTKRLHVKRCCNS